MTPTQHVLFTIALLPVLALVLLLVPSRLRSVREVIAILATFANLGLTLSTFGQDFQDSVPWLGTQFQLSVRVYHTYCSCSSSGKAS